MTAEEVLVGLKTAISKGESKESAMQSFINAGYSPQEVQEAGAKVNMGVSEKLAPPVNAPIAQAQPQKKKGFSLFKKKTPAAVTPQPPTTPVTQEAPTTPQTKSKKIIILISALVVLLLILGFLFFI